MKENDLVMLRLPTPFGYSNTWWRVRFVDNDDTFVGELERCHWHEFKTYKKGDNQRFSCPQVQATHKPDEQFCYSDDITVCSCSGLCRNK